MNGHKHFTILMLMHAFIIIMDVHLHHRHALSNNHEELRHPHNHARQEAKVGYSQSTVFKKHTKENTTENIKLPRIKLDILIIITK